jgi:hypothetical protein
MGDPRWIEVQDFDQAQAEALDKIRHARSFYVATVDAAGEVSSGTMVVGDLDVGRFPWIVQLDVFGKLCRFEKILENDENDAEKDAK